MFESNGAELQLLLVVLEFMLEQSSAYSALQALKADILESTVPVEPRKIWLLAYAVLTSDSRLAISTVPIIEYAYNRPTGGRRSSWSYHTRRGRVNCGCAYAGTSCHNLVEFHCFSYPYVLENYLLWYKIYLSSFWLMAVRKSCRNCV